MSNFASKKNHGYVVVDFNKVNEQGLKKLIAALKRAGHAVTDLEASNKPTRKDGQQVKRAKFFFENGQTMTIFVGSQGDVYQLLLNSTKQPLPDSDNDRELAKYMGQLMERNQKKFDKALARKAAKALKPVDNQKPLSRSLGARVTRAKEQLESVNKTKAQVESSLAVSQSEAQQAQDKLDELAAQLEAEKAETAELEKQLQELA